MRVAFRQPRHQGHALAIDDLAACLRNLTRSTGHRADPVALDEHIAVKSGRTARVEDLCSDNHRVTHGTTPPNRHTPGITTFKMIREPPRRPRNGPCPVWKVALSQ